MRRPRPHPFAATLLALAFAACSDNPTAPEPNGARPRLETSGATAGPVTFCNPASITVPDASRAIPYPSTIDVATDITAEFLKVTVTLNNANILGIRFLRIALQGPGGQAVQLMSNAGQTTTHFQSSFVTFDDDALAQIPASSGTISGTFKPSGFGSTGMPSPAPPGAYATTLATFAHANPNGTWRLFVFDNILFSGGSGTISGGWCISIKPLSSVPVANAGGPYSAIEGTSIAFDGSASTDEGNDIVSYAWNFGDGTTGTGPTPAHTYDLMGTYTVRLRVTDAEGAIGDAVATVSVLNQPGTSERYCNLTPLTIAESSPASLYPSSLTVATGITGPFKVTVTLTGLTVPFLWDLDALLVGPGGRTVMLMSDLGGLIGGSSFSNATVTLDDDASLRFPTVAAGLLSSGIYKPADGGVVKEMPPPAPPFGPYGAALADFTGASPNGTWSLFLRDWNASAAGGGSVSGGWCVDLFELATNSPPVAHAGGAYSGVEGAPITFDGTASTDPDNNIATYAWDFGDGNTGSGATVQHTYADGGTYTVTLTVSDADGATSSATATAMIAHVAPTATLNAPADVSEGNAALISLTSPSAVGARYAFDCGGGYGDIGAAASASCPTTDNGTLTVRAMVVDAAIDELSTEYMATVNVTNVAPTVTSIALPASPVAVNTPVSLSAVFTDPGTADLHTGGFELGGSAVAGAIASGSMTATVTFEQPGVYTITARVSDDDGGVGTRSSASDVTAFVVVYDPSGGFVTGGGWIASPAGAYAPEPSFTGKASFGFVAKYKPGASAPSGNTEFQFKAGGLNFKSTSYEWLVVSAAHAKYKGEGTINGGGSYGFMLTAVDGDRKSGDEPDEFRIRIWDLSSGAVVYDNKMGDADDSVSGTTLGGGSIVIHR